MKLLPSFSLNVAAGATPALYPGSDRVAIEALHVSPRHIYFGHHGRPPGECPILSVRELECVAGRGIRGDRFFDFKAGYKGQITFFAAEVWDEFSRAFSITTPAQTRRNVLVRGAALDALVGRTFELQGVRFAGIEECRPCYWMDAAFGPGANDWLHGRGGLRARILTDGWLRHSSAAELRVGP